MVKKNLEIFHKTFGQVSNLDKLEIIFSKQTSDTMWQEVESIMEIYQGCEGKILRGAFSYWKIKS